MLRRITDWSPVVVKVLERLIHQQLYDYLQENKILDPAQFGFRPGHSTQDASVNLVEDWRDALDKDICWLALCLLI